MKDKLLFVTVTVLGVLGFAGNAFATIPADPTAGAMADVQTKTQTWVTTYGVPVLFGLILLGILIRLGVRWAKKAGRSV